MNAITEYTLNNLNYNNTDESKAEISKDNKNIIRIKKNDKYIYLGSKYSVKRDIDNFTKELSDINDETIIIVFGLGAGEHILEVLKNTNYNKLLVIEPDISVINTFLKLDNSKSIIDNDRFILNLYDKNITKKILASILNLIDANNVKILSYANYDYIYINEYNHLLKVCVETIKSCLINLNTEIRFSKKYLQVYLDNMKNVIKSKPINDFKNLCDNMPAIVVSAGPSLSKNIKMLKKAQDKFIIICGARTLKPLLDVGVIPDCVCIIDPIDINYNFIKKCDNLNPIMIYCEVSNFKTVNAYKGNKIIFKESFNFRNLSCELLEYKLDGLWSGGSVAHTCTSFANYIGCKEIIFIGQDLAYTNNKYHADIADCLNENDGKIINDDIIYVDDINGQKVATSKILNFYKINFEDYINKNKNIKFINATEGGADIKGTKIMTLQEVINNHNVILDKSVLSIKAKNSHKFDKQLIIDNFKLIIKDLDKEQCRCQKIIDELKKINIKEIKINKKTIKLLKKIKSNNTNIEKLDMLNSLVNPVINKIISKPEYRENNKDDEMQKIKKLIEQTKPIYDVVIKSINEVIPMINKLISELEGEKIE